VQFFRERDEVDSVLGFGERDHLGENVAVLRQEEVFGPEGFDGGVEGVVVQENGAEDGALGVQVARKGAFELRINRHVTKRALAASLLLRLSFLINSTLPGI